MTDPTATDAAIAACDRFIAKQSIDKNARRWRLDLPQPPRFGFDTKTRYFWDIETNKGSIQVRLRPDVAPEHVSSTVYLVRIGFYDELSFHRVIPGFMAQGGCPLGTGTAGPGYEYDGEFDRSVRHDRGGLLSMANAGPGTDGSQFFLTFVATSWLDDKHSIFGEVVDSDASLRALEASGTKSGTTREPLLMTRSTIRVA